MVKNLFDGSVFVAGLVFGTSSSILSKQLFAETVDEKAFEKPLFQTTLMFFGMLLALPIHMLYESFSARSVSKSATIAIDDSNASDYTLLGLESESLQVSRDGISDGVTPTSPIPESSNSESRDLKQWTFRDARILFIPSVFDLLATALANIGLVMIDVSVYQLMKCTVIVFVAILKRVFMHTRLRPYMWAGVALNMIAVTLVASTSFMKGTDGDSSAPGSNLTGLYEDVMFDSDGPQSKETKSAGLGILLVVLSCAVQAAQYVFEEKVMGAHESGVSFPPLVVVGMEGLWGLLMSLFVVLPIASALPGKDCNTAGSCSYEDTFDTLRMCSESTTVSWMLLAYVLIITGYNAAGIGITYLCDSVWHSILDNFRPVSVWATQLVIFQLSSGRKGEEWISTSWLQLGGLILLLFGTAVYNANIQLGCCFSYPGSSSGDRVEFDMEDPRNSISQDRRHGGGASGNEPSMATSLATSPFVTARSPNVRAVIHQRRESIAE